MPESPDSVKWRAQPAAVLETLAQAWSVVDFFAEVPRHLQGSLLLALTRRKALVVEFTDGRSMLLIHFDDAAAVWQHGTCERCVSVQRVRLDNAWLLALVPQGNGQSLRSLPPGTLTLSPAARGHVDVHIGTQLRITGLPPSRSWDWAWGPTLGPLYLSIYVGRSVAQILEWLRANLPEGYVLDGHCARATRNPQPEGRLRHTDEIRVREGEIHFLHGHYRHIEPVDNARAVFLLRKLAKGELGELSFDLFDGDYLSLCATGYCGASLHKYLDRRPHYDRKQPHPWNCLRHLVIDVPAGSDVTEHTRLSLNRELGLADDAPLGAALALPLQELPRRITVLLPGGVREFDRNRHDPGNGTFKRIRWWTQHAPGAAGS